jgi:hypothetical protein
VGFWIAEESNNPISLILGYLTTITFDGSGSNLLVGDTLIVKILGIQARRHRCGADNVGKEYG